MSFRYSDAVCDLTVLWEMASSSAISASDRCVASSGSRRSSAAVSAEAPAAAGPCLPGSRVRSARA